MADRSEYTAAVALPSLHPDQQLAPKIRRLRRIAAQNLLQPFAQPGDIAHRDRKIGGTTGKGGREQSVSSQQLVLHQHQQPDEGYDDRTTDQNGHEQRGRGAPPPQHGGKTAIRRPGDIGEDRRPD